MPSLLFPIGRGSFTHVGCIFVYTLYRTTRYAFHYLGCMRKLITLQLATMGYGWQAGGTHPTGMLSCWLNFCRPVEKYYKNVSTFQEKFQLRFLRWRWEMVISDVFCYFTDDPTFTKRPNTDTFCTSKDKKEQENATKTSAKCLIAF